MLMQNPHEPEPIFPALPEPSPAEPCRFLDTLIPLGPWRLMGMWQDGPSFLVTLGDSGEDCLERMEFALEDYTHADLTRVDSFWLEAWGFDRFSVEEEWVPVEVVSHKRLALRKAACEQHQRARDRRKEPAR